LRRRLVRGICESGANGRRVMPRSEGVGRKRTRGEGVRRRSVLRSVELKGGLGTIMGVNVCVRMRGSVMKGTGQILVVLTIEEITKRVSVRMGVTKSVLGRAGRIV
tara:strand:- start:244 stop:561 length:318 start_codon:yes stop_codon:yes gene_type:complete